MKHWIWILGPLLALAIFTPFSAALDLAVARHFFYHSSPPAFHSTPFATFLYDYGVIPGNVVCAVSVLILLGYPWLKQRYQPLILSALIMVLTLGIGSGLIVHASLKDHWGRPRPKQVVEFGGQFDFRPYYKPSIPPLQEPAKSFACGHCSMGFYFFALALIGNHYKKRWITLTGVTLALFLGLSLSWSRMQQGGHFLSDTIVSGVIMWLTAYLVTASVFFFCEGRTTQPK